jgi:hypothetical protein
VLDEDCVTDTVSLGGGGVGFAVIVFLALELLDTLDVRVIVDELVDERETVILFVAVPLADDVLLVVPESVPEDVDVEDCVCLLVELKDEL